MDTPAAVLQFWFEETPPAAWFRPGPERDRTVRERFGDLTEQALAGELAPWGDSAADALALLLVLDQFPRQIWRDQARAFQGDGQAQPYNHKPKRNWKTGDRKFKKSYLLQSAVNTQSKQKYKSHNLQVCPSFIAYHKMDEE